ncbi:kanadaptin [Apis mellifera caucasica]|uniref:Kanadaptin n=1 Tax=Apis mellifera TaxID=7460 RepID=A0A7M7LLS7_APIME|nr:kanadaptin [Apis mellifera]KAG6796129.1 kanadaptin [Apis mellifera caucasica]KAG9427852.1 kanadaptin [Apis mellifera carnica]|eukprot:XP_006557362.1 kanadaptin [Apis mellifera]
METGSNEFESRNCLNDGEENVQNEINNEKISVNKTSICSDTSEKDTISIKDNIVTFKKPTVLIGPKRSGSIHKISKTSLSTDTCLRENSDENHSNRDKSQEHLQDCSYIEPPWGGKPKENYKMEVLKSGVIVETISLNEQSFYVIGRLPSCHLSLAHPTISRYHAVLQYRLEEDKDNDKGFYVYDLGSTHGTFWNGSRIKPNIYVRIRGGHMLRFGCSQRKYILQAPPEDVEEESQYSLTELKEMRASQLQRYEKEKAEESIEDKESEGIDWGMGEDAEEETDLQENPYASFADEDLILEDPKKTLRGWFEREGYDLHYQVEEKGFGQFLCWVDLPTEDIVGHSMRAEALVKGKKKEAVIQCALEACKILDRYGLLRQANHEARKRKTRNWEAEDYYDSDEDNFLDRTGSIEKKREQRMRLAGKLEQKVETYDSLLEKHKEVTEKITHLSTSIQNWQNVNTTKIDTTEEDALDAFMSSLNSFALTKNDIAKMKLELQNLQKEESNLIKLLNLTQPANLPTLSYSNTNYSTDADMTVIKKIPSETKKLHHNSLIRRKKEKQTNQHENTLSKLHVENITVETECIEEVDSDDESTSNSSHNELCNKNVELQRSNNTIVTDKNESSEKHEEQHKHKTQKAQVTKKHRQKQQKIYCDQDTDNYSTWIPPSDQAGDGKTSLNEKYGY